MKRDIKCSTCTDAYRKPKREFDNYGEAVKIVPGIALQDYKCDLCNADLVKGSLCWGVSVYSDRLPYFSWESDCMTVISLHDADAMRDTIERLSKEKPSVGYDG